MTLSSLFSVFPKDKILVELFENIGSRDAVSFFTESIGLEKRPNPLKYVNGQDYSTRFSTQVSKKIVEIFRETCSAVTAMLPATRELWLGSKLP